MKKILIALILMSLLPLVSAGDGNEATVVGGTIYENVVENGVNGASVVVSCNGFNESAVSGSAGQYSVSFASDECECGDSVYVFASKGSLSGSSMGAVDMCNLTPVPSLELDVAIVNVPLVPEFGVIVGLVTVLGAVGIFFVVRKK